MNPHHPFVSRSESPPKHVAGLKAGSHIGRKLRLLTRGLPAAPASWRAAPLTACLTIALAALTVAPARASSILLPFPAPAAALLLHPAATPTVTVTGVALVSATGTATPTSDNKVVGATDSATLYAVVHVIYDATGETRHYVGGATSGLPAQAIVAGKTLTLTPWDDAALGPLDVRIYEIPVHDHHQDSAEWVTSTYPFYTNVDPDTASWIAYDTIEYGFPQTLAQSGWRHVLASDAGTRFWRAEVSSKGNTYSTLGSGDEATASNLEAAAYSLGITAGVHRLSRLGALAAGTSVGRVVEHAEAFRRIPWLYGSEGSSTSSHQSERYVGFDCADLAVAAYRASGKSATYTSAHWLGTGSQTKAVGALGKLYWDVDSSTWRDATTREAVTVEIGTASQQVRPGDLIFFDWDGLDAVGAADQRYDHTTIVRADDGQTPGRLDLYDSLTYATHRYYNSWTGTYEPNHHADGGVGWDTLDATLGGRKSSASPPVMLIRRFKDL
ncbi:MAG: hypothetical protein HYV63_03770 [Candidatus Schekmanbacteria bacterium]|nr:hypothetical protein [Candidatus Schekmanbacteria bacterium]